MGGLIGPSLLSPSESECWSDPSPVLIVRRLTSAVPLFQGIVLTIPLSENPSSCKLITDFAETFIGGSYFWFRCRVTKQHILEVVQHFTSQEYSEAPSHSTLSFSTTLGRRLSTFQRLCRPSEIYCRFFVALV